MGGSGLDRQTAALEFLSSLALVRVKKTGSSSSIEE
jgi:hypothetical protein